MQNDTDSSERVTYLIASYNRGAYVGDCLRSLHRQTDPEWLAVVVDDASTDDSVPIITRHLEERIRLRINDRNIGYIGTLKRLIDEASTDIVAILDADDALSPDATERLRQAYARDRLAQFVHSRFAICDAALTPVGDAHGAAIPVGSTALRDGVVGHILSFRRTAYHRTSGLDDTMTYAEDRDLVYKLEEVTRPVFIDAVLYRYRQLPESQSSDPIKREIGARNTRRARRVALARRHLSGVRRLGYEWLFWADYLAYSNRHPAVVRRLARSLVRAARLVARPCDPRGR